MSVRAERTGFTPVHHRYYLQQMERWLQSEEPGLFSQYVGVSRTRDYGERVATEVVRALLALAEGTALEPFYEEGRARWPEGVLWEYALAWLCSRRSLEQFVRNASSLHRSVRRQEGVGSRLAQEVRHRGQELLETCAREYIPDDPDLPDFLRQVVLRMYLASPAERARDWPSLGQIDQALGAGLISLKASTLLKLADYGRGLTPEEQLMAHDWLGPDWMGLPSGARVRLDALASAAGYARREVMTAALARWRRQIRTQSSQTGKPHA